MVDDVATTLTASLRARARPEGLPWLDATLEDLAAGRGDLGVAFASAARHVGRGGLDQPGAALPTAGGDQMSLAAWRLDDAARALMLLAVGRHAPTTVLAQARDCYFQGDARERTGALRALSLLPGAATDASALPAVLDAVRITQGEILEAAICDNPYASWHLPQHEWRTAALKVLFLGHSIHRVARLEQRADAALAQSLVDLASEREAAGRVVSPDTWTLAARFPPPGLTAKLLAYLEHASREHRLGAATALATLAAHDAALVAVLAERAARQSDPAIRDLLAPAKA